MVCYRRDMYMVYVQIIQRTEKNILKIRSPVYQREATHLIAFLCKIDYGK